MGSRQKDCRLIRISLKAASAFEEIGIGIMERETELSASDGKER